MCCVPRAMRNGVRNVRSSGPNSTFIVSPPCGGGRRGATLCVGEQRVQQRPPAKAHRVGRRQPNLVGRGGDGRARVVIAQANCVEGQRHSGRGPPPGGGGLVKGPPAGKR